MDNIVAFSQRDPRWAGEPLGTGTLTLGEAGCLVSAAAALLASWGVKTDPQKLNTWLKGHKGYLDGNLFIFAAIDGQACRFIELIRCEKQPAPVERLRNALAGGAGVLACVDWQPGGKFQQHWVWLVSLGERSGHVVDPWQLPGAELVDLGRYLAAGWTPARGLFAAAIYSRLGTVRRVQWPSVLWEFQETVCQWQDGDAV